VSYKPVCTTPQRLILPHSITVAMMSRITLHLKRFGNRPNGVAHRETPLRPPPIFGHRRFNSSDPLMSLSLSSVSAPAYALPSAAQGTSSFIDTFVSVHGDDEPVGRTTSETGSHFAMGTFSAGMDSDTKTAGEMDAAQHAQRILV
jgi:hypothetical protein